MKRLLFVACALALAVTLISLVRPALAAQTVQITLAEKMVGPPGKEEYSNHPDAKPQGVTTTFRRTDQQPKMWVYCTFAPPFTEGLRWIVVVNQVVDGAEKEYTSPQFTTMGGDKSAWTDLVVPPFAGDYVIHLKNDNDGKVYASANFKVVK